MSPEERAESEAQKAARQYWQRKVEDERSPPEAAPPSKAEKDAQKSAREYWEREVAEEKVRRGTAETPPDE